MKYTYLPEQTLHTVQGLGDEVLVELALPASGLNGTDQFAVRMLPDNARTLARALLQAADQVDGQKSYLPN